MNPILQRINEWKQQKLTPFYFGLGFIQIKLSFSERWHFYHPEIQGIVGQEEVHNHRYDFASTVMAGTLTNECFRFKQASKGAFRLEQESCNPSLPIVQHQVNWGDLEQLSCATYAQGQTYQMHHAVLHRVWSDHGAVTRLHRSHYAKDVADVVRPRYADKVCPFSKALSSEECWSIMESVASIYKTEAQ